MLRRRLHIAESMADVNGKLIMQPTKTYERRYVTLPTQVIDNLARRLETVPPGGDTLVFTSRRHTPLGTRTSDGAILTRPPPAPVSPRLRLTDCATPAPASSSIVAPTLLPCNGTSAIGM